MIQHTSHASDKYMKYQNNKTYKGLTESGAKQIVPYTARKNVVLLMQHIV